MNLSELSEGSPPTTEGGGSTPHPEAGGGMEGGTDGGAPGPDGATPGTFSDDFARPDGPVGNGWSEKVGGTFRLVGGRVRMASGNHQSLVLTRPAGEDVRDVQASVEVVYTSTAPGSSTDAYVLARIQRPTLATPEMLDGYAGYIGDYAALRIGRSRGPGITTISDTPIPRVDRNHVYRVTLRVTGTSPVSIYAEVAQRDPEGTVWTRIAEAQVDDTAGDRVQGAGTVGLASDTVAVCEIDGFLRTNL